MKKILALYLIILTSIGASYSQSIWTLSMEPATPLGDMRDFIDKSTFRGLSGSANWFIKDKLTVGFAVPWTGFYQKDERGTWQYDGGAVTATAWKEFYILPLYVNAKYHFGKEEEARFLPYAGFSAGVAYIEQLAQVGTYEFESKKWKFAMSPEVGTMLPMGIEQSWGFDLKLRYQMAFYNENNINLMHFLNYSIGVYWKINPGVERF